MKGTEFEDERQELLGRISKLDAERNRLLGAETAMRKALNRLDDLHSRLRIFQDFVASSLVIDDEQSFIEHSLETVIETHEMEMAAFLVAEPDERIRLAGGLGLVDVGGEVILDLSAVPSDRSGFLRNGDAMSPLAEALGMAEGMYCVYRGKGTQLGGLLAAGNSESGLGLYQKPTGDHLSLFVILSAQIGGLWTNYFLEILARYDGLTSLLNQRSFYGELHREFSRGQRSGEELSLLYFDLDGFGAVNDTLGHQSGDDILVMVADVLNSTKRKEDVVARYGGDEFCAVLPHTSTGNAELVAHRIIENFNDRIGDYNVTSSIGIATTDLREMGSPDSLVKAADARMYASKAMKGHAITSKGRGPEVRHSSRDAR